MTNALSSRSQKVFIELLELSKRYPVSTFDEVAGTFHTEGSNSGFVAGTPTAVKLFAEDNENPFWSGCVICERTKDDEVKFQLCLQAKLGADNQKLIQWRQIPSVLSVFGKGYDPLSEAEAAATLDDLATFHTEVKVRGHFDIEGAPVSVSGVFTDQDGLKDLSEVLLTWDHTEPFPAPDQVVVLELELFETTYFIIGLVAEADSEYLIVQLTNHFYSQARRIGRRIAIDRLRVGEFEVVGISDSGMTAEIPPEKAPSLGDNVSLTLPAGGTVSFSVIYWKQVAQCVRCGLMLFGDSPEERKAWQDFILQFQYSLLSTRKIEDHESCRTLLKEAGYLSGTVGEMVNTSWDSIFKEWTLVDQEGPYKGVSVCGKHEGKCVATIGITRAADSVWVAQAAAVIDDPKFLEYTKSIYGWRTRAILQQPDGMYHLAFFAANKPFLDRFFRKFYLQLPEDEQHLVTWNEWQPSFLKLAQLEPSTANKTTEAPSSELLEKHKLFRLLGENSKSDLVVKQNGGTVLVRGRPHQHLAQFLASVWIPHNSAPPLQEIGSIYREHGHPFAVLMTERRGLKELYKEEIEKGLLIEGEDEVVWTCHRSLLPRFLSNSLKALQIMVRKYGARNVA